MIIEAALVLGMPSGVNSVGAAIVSGSSFDFARARCDRAGAEGDDATVRPPDGAADDGGDQ